jgi:hypothetical protein
VARDVLDLVGDRAAVDLPEAGEHVLQRFAADVDAQHVGWNLAHDLRRQIQVGRIERRVTPGLGAQRIELGRQVPMRTMGAHHRHRGSHVIQHVLRKPLGDGGRCGA